MWREGHEIRAVDKDVVNLHKKRIVREIKKSTANKFEVGDLVRVKMGALFSKIRKLIKSDNKKLIVVNYSPDVYTISSILNKDLKDTILCISRLYPVHLHQMVLLRGKIEEYEKFYEN